MIEDHPDVAAFWMGPEDSGLSMGGAITWFLTHGKGHGGASAQGLQDARAFIRRHLEAFIHQNIWTFEAIMRLGVMFLVEFPSNVKVFDYRGQPIPLTLGAHGMDRARFVRVARVSSKSPKGMRDDG